MAMYPSDRPTGSPCLRCPDDGTCGHPCIVFRDWFHERWPGPKAERLGEIDPDEDFKACRWCGIAFHPGNPREQYCCEACRAQAKRKQNREFMRTQRK